MSRRLDLPEYQDDIEPEWLDWYRKTPVERLAGTEELWANYLAMGGSLDPDPDPESPFWSREEIESFARDAARTRERAFQTAPSSS